ncbi:MAG: flagellar hook-associated protein FlgK [Rhodobacteraceae bacterium]|nr:flagellar hook-associated protein FlgK [Paracoccaceae bacterium]
MTISGALFNALSGLTANSRAAELVSSNVANSTTEGYGMRELDLSSQVLAGSGYGVRTGTVVRIVDEGLIEDRRLAEAGVGNGNTLARFLSDLENIIGIPDQEGSLSGRLAAFESALIEAGARPDSQARLSNLLSAAQGVTQHLNASSDAIQTARMDADREIALQVDRLNAGLASVKNINYEIQTSLARGQDPSSLMDLRQQTIDDISSIVPLRQVPRSNGQVALFTPGGAILLDGRAAELEFSPTGFIVPEMTLASSALSGLTINDRDTRTSGGRSPIAGGSLAALFEIRDERAVSAQVQLDAMARDLVERFQDPALDATRAPGAAGLFTDADAAFLPADEVALSTRLSVNSVVDPDQGGALWRLRAGLGAAVPGDVGNGVLLADMATALTANRVPASGDITTAARSASGLAAEFLSLVGAGKRDVEYELGFSIATHETLKLLELETGVDTDVEMQKLMLVEQAYAANARVMTTADDMLQLLMQL